MHFRLENPISSILKLIATFCLKDVSGSFQEQLMNEIKLTQIESMIYLIRGHKVMLDSDLAELYGVETKVLNQAVRRNIDRFPQDFMFQLTPEEYQILKSQIVTSKTGSGGKQKLPWFSQKMVWQCFLEF